jgi:dihydrofolate reductase
MRKLVVLTFLTLDGVMQAPGGPEEDPSDGFRYGGWTFPYFDEFMGQVMASQMDHDFELLLGRKTYDIFAEYWPNIDDEKNYIAAAFNKTTKYVVSASLKKVKWKNSILINKNVPEEIQNLKEMDGPELQVHGSGNLVQTLLKHDLIDEFWLKIFPVVVGSGKKLFSNGSLAGEFKLIESKISPSGVIVGNYVRGGEVKTGTFGS